MDNFRTEVRTVKIADYRLSGGEGLFLIAGPCVIESEQLALEVATEVARVGRVTGIPVLFKSSFDKANRTSVDSFRGPGITRGLEILAMYGRRPESPCFQTSIHPTRPRWRAKCST